MNKHLFLMHVTSIHQKTDEELYARLATIDENLQKRSSAAWLVEVTLITNELERRVSK